MAVMKRNDWIDVGIRFVVGGSVLVAVYVLSALLPWRSFAGVFAAFPGVMAAAVGIAGWRQGSALASEVARGSVVGMLGGLACIITSLILLPVLQNWWVTLILAIVAWLAVSVAIHAALRAVRRRRENGR